MLARNGYPAGVPCWIDIIQPDVDATMAFYGDLFGWDFEPRTPDGVSPRYAYARVDGLLVAGVGGPPVGDTDPSGWTTYVWVDSADETAALVEANGGRVLVGPVDIPRAGRVAVCTDPSGAIIGLWQAAENRGAQLVNAPGAWNFSQLDVGEPAGAEGFYGAVFGWVTDPLAMGSDQETGMWRVPGYGDFLAESDPEIRSRQEADQAPAGFADAVAITSLSTTRGATDTPAGWTVIFAVADADTAFDQAIELGATVITPLFDTTYTRMGTVRDPQGAVFTVSDYRPPTPG